MKKTTRILVMLLVVIFSASLNAQKKVLVLTETAGFDHNTRDAVVPVIQQLGIDNNFSVDHTNTSTGYFTETNLAEYDAILFMNSTGDFLDASEQTALTNYITNGGGALFNHAAADAEYDWPYYHELVGGKFQNHQFGIYENDLIVVNNTNIATDFVTGDTWTRTEEYYYFTPVPGEDPTNPPVVDPAENDNLEYLLLIDEPSSPSGRDFLHPISWYQYYGGGRSWYTGLGHSSETIEDEEVKQHILGGILFVIGEYDPEGPAMSVSPTSKSFGMKQEDHNSVAPFTITVTNATPSLGELNNLALTPDVDWLDITFDSSDGDNLNYTCTVNSNANDLPLGEANAVITVSADDVMSKTITVTNSVSPGGPNLALNKPITASSIENAGTPAVNANDGDLNTRWSSGFNDGETLTIDLEASYNIDFIKLIWEGAYADQYEILMGEDLDNMTQVYVENLGQGGEEEITLNGTGRYIRLVCTSRSTIYGSSLWEFEAYGYPSTLSIENIDHTNISTYPNPVNGNDIFINLSNSNREKYSVDIISMTGKLIKHYEFKNSSSIKKINIADLNISGLFFLKYSDAQGSSIKKMLKL